MSEQPPKNTGRTLYDFLLTIFENRSALYWSNGVAWLALLGVVTALYSGQLVLRGTSDAAAPADAGSPSVHYESVYAAVSQSDCQSAVLQTTSRVAPTKIGKRFDGTEHFTQYVEFGPFNAWISCISPSPDTMIYLGVAGNEDDKAHEILTRLSSEVQGTLLRP